MTLINIKTKTQDETKKIAQNLGQRLPSKIIICLKGPLGSGKTTFIQGLVSAISDAKVTSPTYVYHQRYLANNNLIIDHFDLYRVHQNPQLINRTGILEVLDNVEGWVIIEWPLDNLKYPTNIPRLMIRTNQKFEFKITKNFL